MTCPLRTAAATVALTTPAGDMDRPTDSMARPSGPAPAPDASTLPNVGISERITRRSAKLRHANGVQAGRYRAVHMILGRCGVGDA